MDGGVMESAVDAANEDLQGFAGMQEIVAAALERDHLLAPIEVFTPQFQEAIAVPETGGDGFALQISEGQQVGVDLEGHAGVFAAV